MARKVKKVAPAAPVQNDLITRLKAHMKATDSNQRATSEALGIGESHLNRWLNGHVKPCGAWKRLIEEHIGA